MSFTIYLAITALVFAVGFILGYKIKKSNIKTNDTNTGNKKFDEYQIIVDEYIFKMHESISNAHSEFSKMQNCTEKYTKKLNIIADNRKIDYENTENKQKKELYKISQIPKDYADKK